MTEVYWSDFLTPKFENFKVRKFNFLDGQYLFTPSLVEK